MFTGQDFKSMLGHFTKLCMEGLNALIRLKHGDHIIFPSFVPTMSPLPIVLIVNLSAKGNQKPIDFYINTW